MNKKLLAEVKGTKSYIILQALCRWATLLAQIVVVYSIATISEIALEGYGVDKVILAKHSVYIILAILIAFATDRSYVSLSTKASNKIVKQLLLRGAKSIYAILNRPHWSQYIGGYCPQVIYTVMAALTIALVLFTANVILAIFVLLAIILMPIVIQMAYIGVGRMVSDIFACGAFVASLVITLEFYASEKVTVAGAIMVILLTWEAFSAVRTLARLAVDAKECKEAAKQVYLALGEITEEDEDEDEDEDDEDRDEEEDPIEFIEGGEKTEVLASKVSETETEEVKEELTVSDLEDMLAEARGELGIKSNKDKNEDGAEDSEEFAEGIDIADKKQNGVKQIMQFIKTIITPAVIIMIFAGFMEILAGVLGLSDMIGKNYQPWFYAILFALIVVSAVLNEIGRRVKKINPDGIVRVQSASVIAIFITVFIGRYSMLTAMITLLGCYLVAVLIPYLDARRKKLPLKKIAESKEELDKAIEALTDPEAGVEEFNALNENKNLSMDNPDNQIEQDINDFKLNAVSYKYDHLRRDLDGLNKKDADKKSFTGMASTLAMLVILLIAVWQLGYGALSQLEYMLVISGAYFTLKYLKDR